MSNATLLAEDRREQILIDSIQGKCQAIVTHRGLNGWRTFKSCFASGSRTANVVHLVLREVLDRQVVRVGDTLGVTFRVGHSKCMFSGAVLSLLSTEDGLRVSLPWPADVQRLQRRAYQRTVPPRSQVIAVRFWRTSVNSSAAREPEVKYGQLEDLSAGGIRLRVTDPENLELDVPYRCSFSPRPGAPALVLEATLRHHEAAANGKASLGFQFLGLETSAEGQRALARLARVVQSFHQGRGRSSRPDNGSEPKDSITTG